MDDDTENDKQARQLHATTLVSGRLANGTIGAWLSGSRTSGQSPQRTATPAPTGNERATGWLKGHDKMSRSRPTDGREASATSRAAHVAVGERLIDQQRTIVATLDADGRPTGTARKLLAKFEALQAMHIADRDRLAAELAHWAD